MNKLCARLEQIVNNRRQRVRTKNCPHCRTNAPQLSEQFESTQSAGRKNDFELSRVPAGLIYYY